MPDGPPILFVLVAIGFVVLLIVAVYYAHKAAEKRRLELLALSQELGLDFQPGYGQPAPEHGIFGCFKRGHSRRSLNTMRGELEFFGRPSPCLLGDYEYKETSGSGKNRRTTTYRFSYLMVRIPWSIPAFTMRREHIFDKLAGALGFDDIDFESEEFSRRFHVKCADKRFAYDVIHPRMMEFLLSATPPPIETSGDWCILTDGSSSWNPQEIRGRVGFARAFFERWPEHLVRDLESRGAGGGIRL